MKGFAVALSLTTTARDYDTTDAEIEWVRGTGADPHSPFSTINSLAANKPGSLSV